MTHTPQKPAQDGGEGILLNVSPPLLSPPNLQASSSSQHGGPAGETNPREVETAHACRLPPFWKANPELWFFQVESMFSTSCVRSDEGKYHLVVGALDPESLLDVSDIIRCPPRQEKYQYLKTHIMNRFSDSPDRQLAKLLNELRLGDKKPSQLLRQMRVLAGDKATEDVLRVKWLALLPANTQRFLKIFRTPQLNELAVAADELVEAPPAPNIMAAGTTSRALSPVRRILEPPRTDGAASEADLSDVRRSLAQLI